MATDEKYEITMERKVVFKAVDKKTKEVLYLGVGVANIENMFVELYELEVRALLYEPVEVQKRPKSEVRYTIIHVMADEYNENRYAIDLAEKIIAGYNPKPTIPFRTSDLRATYLFAGFAEY